MANPKYKMENSWFASWFDSPYYPILYQHRDYAEAEKFVSNLLDDLEADPGAHFLDLACGRGRHSLFIRQKGYRVTGLDLSPDSIRDAQEHADEQLDFGVHDMRDPLPETYDKILNLFTSFGYFDRREENLKVLKNVRNALKPEGTLVLDFMNVEQVIPNLVAREEKTLNGVNFRLQRSVRDGFIVKDISIRDGDQQHFFQEKVQALTMDDFADLFEAAGLTPWQIWGDYNGTSFSPASSPRLIYFCDRID